MSTLTKLAASMVGRWRPTHVRWLAREEGGATALTLPPPETTGGLPLLDALRLRHSERSFSPEPLAPAVLSSLLWAADGVNRRDTGGRTAPSALDAREVAIFAALEDGAHVYDPESHALRLVRGADVRALTGYQTFVDRAALDLIYVAKYPLLPAASPAARRMYAAASAGAMAQNVYLFCASAGLSAVVRGWLDRRALSEALGLGMQDEVLLAQTVGYPAQQG